MEDYPDGGKKICIFKENNLIRKWEKKNRAVKRKEKKCK